MYQYHANTHLKALKENQYQHKLEAWFKKHHSTDANTPYYKALHLDNLDIDVEIPTMHNCTDLVVIAMGGASLVAQIICNLSKSSIRTHFLNSTDPQYFEDFFAKLNLTHTNILIISNSGETTETIALTQAVMEQYQHKGIALSHKIISITKPDSSLAQILAPDNIQIIPHASEINGKFSLFSNIANVIASLLKIDITSFFNGAQQTFNDFWEENIQSLPAQSALSIVTAQHQTHIHCTHTQALTPLLNWSTQLINESLASEKEKWCAYTAICPQDQHGVFQSYLAGDNDRIFTIFKVGDPSNNSPLYNVHNATQECTVQSLNNAGKAVRSFTLETPNAYNIGAVAAHLMIEIILVGELLNLKPFEQPEIEALKRDIICHMNNI